MRRSHVLCSIGGLTALLAVAAVCYAYPQAVPEVPLPPDSKPPAAKPTPADKPSARPPMPPADLTPWAPPTKPTVAVCPPPTCPVPTAVTSAAPAGTASVYDLVERVEALKAKREAIDQELREAQALLNEKFRALQERVGKAGVVGPPVAAGSYEPVTTYQTILVKDPETGEVKRVVRAVTSYVPRGVSVPAAPAVPPTAPSSDLPPPAPAPAAPKAVPSY